MTHPEKSAIRYSKTELPPSNSSHDMLRNPDLKSNAPLIAVLERVSPGGNTHISLAGCQTTPEALHWLRVQR